MHRSLSHFFKCFIPAPGTFCIVQTDGVAKCKLLCPQHEEMGSRNAESQAWAQQGSGQLRACILSEALTESDDHPGLRMAISKNGSFCHQMTRTLGCFGMSPTTNKSLNKRSKRQVGRDFYTKTTNRIHRSESSICTHRVSTNGKEKHRLLIDLPKEKHQSQEPE